jgi:hypothetical protein
MVPCRWGARGSLTIAFCIEDGQHQPNDWDLHLLAGAVPPHFFTFAMCTFM